MLRFWLTTLILIGNLAGLAHAQPTGRVTKVGEPEPSSGELINATDFCKVASYVRTYEGYRSTFVASGLGAATSAWYGDGHLTCFGKSSLIHPSGVTIYDNVDSSISGYWHCSYYLAAGGSPLPEGINGYPPQPFFSGLRVGPPGQEGLTSLTCECSPGTVWHNSHKLCLVQGESTKLLLVLSGSSETRPAGTGGTPTIEVTAKVTQGGTPKVRVAITFAVDVTPNSGAHEHHDVARPKGNISTVQGTTDANGEIKLTFTAPEVSGIHTVKATCATCSNSPAAKEIQVKVPDLVPISPNSPRNADGSLVYALTSVDALHAGEGRYHKNQYYLTEQAQQNLFGLITSFAAAGWGTVALNDASLYWGGRYDIKGNWGGSHLGHRDGREIDISFTRAGNPISKAKQNVFYKKFCEDKAVEAVFSILHHFVAVPHFHVYLEKQKTCNRTEK